MLDTLKLSLTDYEISPDADLEVFLPTLNASTGKLGSRYPLWRNGAGHVMGTKAVYNDEHFNITVKPINPNEPQSIYCGIQFSVPKIAGGSNYEPADHKTTETAIEIVGKELTRIGIRTNILSASLSRLDSCKNVETQEPYQAYHPILAMQRGTRMAKRDYGTTFLWANNSQQVCAYDKLEEMTRRKHTVTGLPSNVIRFEHRCLKAQKVRDLMMVSNVAELLTSFEQVGIGYRAAMEKQLFKFSPDEVQAVTVNDIAEQLKRVRDAGSGANGSRYFVQDWLLRYAFQQLGDDADVLMSAVEQVSEHRSTFMRTRKKLEAARANALEMQQSMCSKRTLGQLYRELEDQVLSAN